MKVSELIAKLNELPQDAEVKYIFDGCARVRIDFAWLCKGGHVALTHFSEVVYADKDRPINAPNVEEERYWRTEDDPENEDE